MIRLLGDENKILSLTYDSVYGGKIKTLYKTYGINTDFCRFFEHNDSLIISQLDRDFIVFNTDKNYDAEELAEFLKASGAISVFLPPEILNDINLFVKGEKLYNNIMEYKGVREYTVLKESPALDDVYNILKHAFNLRYDTWLTDLSHRIRHGISKSVIYENASTITVLHDADNIVFLTQAATLPEMRGKGIATRMLRELAGRYSDEGKKVRLVCRQAKLHFYEQVGFVKIGDSAQIYRFGEDIND